MSSFLKVTKSLERKSLICFFFLLFSLQGLGRKEEVRFLVWVRLYRVRKVDSFFDKLEKDIRINYFAARIVKLLAVEFYCTHTAACIYYYLATTVRTADESYTWIGSLTLGSFSYHDFRAIDIGKRYVTSLYWAILTMATVGTYNLPTPCSWSFPVGCWIGFYFSWNKK